MSASSSTGTSQPRQLASATEQLRLAELACYAITPGQTDPRLDAITQVAVQAAGGDIGGISLVYKSEIWLPSRVGIDVTHVPRAGSFCTVAIEGGADGLFEIADARTDARFNRNSLVTGASPFLHYAAVPLRGARGYMLGTLWMMCAAPGRLSDQQAAMLCAAGRCCPFQTPMGERSKSGEDAPYMNHARRRGKIVAHQSAPFLEVRAVTKMNFVIFEGLPFNHQAIGIRLFNPTFQPHRTASASSLEQGNRLCDTGLELLVGAWFYQNFRNFSNHVCVSRIQLSVVVVRGSRSTGSGYR